VILVFQSDSDSLVETPFALVANDLNCAYLAGIGDVRTAVGL
jgi:hypothetical protein